MIFDKKIITVEKCKDSGLALALISLICYQAWKLEIFILAAISLLIIAMTYPPIFQPFARLWFSLSSVVGTVVSKIILTVLFFLVVLPIGIVRRLMGRDAMLIKRWKQGNESVFRVREHRYTGEDLEHPY
ncbi:MAG: SxtJ family membrane protein [Desulfobulbales bacterium]